MSDHNVLPYKRDSVGQSERAALALCMISSFSTTSLLGIISHPGVEVPSFGYLSRYQEKAVLSLAPPPCSSLLAPLGARRLKVRGVGLACRVLNQRHQRTSSHPDSGEHAQYHSY